MSLKKVNAVLALFSSLALIIHISYNTYSHLTLYYNPFLSKLTAVPCMVLICVHAVCGMCVVFLQGDGTRLDLYGKQNKRLILQRVTAALIFPLLLLHLNSYDLEAACAADQAWFLYTLLTIADILFFAVVLIHMATSFSKAFITLGLLKSQKKQRMMDRIVYILLFAAFLVLMYVVVKGRLSIFLKG